MCQQLTEYLNVNNLFPKWQSAYRQYHSTETALVRLANDLLLSVDQGKMAILVSLDQSAAFDVCDIVILTERLRYSYGINGTALKLLTSYLSNRSVRVKVGNSDLSEFCETKYGVPHGSTLGPLLYILYTGPLIFWLPKVLGASAMQMIYSCILFLKLLLQMLFSILSNVSKKFNFGCKSTS